MAQSRPRILVVDDVEDNVFTLERRLKQFLDPEITSAGNGRVALEKLRAAAFRSRAARRPDARNGWRGGT